MMVADRHVPLDGGSNMRDLGGLPLADGGRVRRGRVYRSAALNELTDADVAVLASIGLGTVVDLRSKTEQTNAPSRLPEGLRVVAPGDGGVGAVPGHRKGPNPVTEAQARRMMREGNRTYAVRMAPAITTTFETLAETDSGGLLFHCAAGKDRTGFVAAVILLSLGASHETVMEDYLATNLIWDRKSAPRISGMPLKAREAVFSAHAEYLEAALETMQKDFGPAENYLTDRCGVSRATLLQVREGLVLRG
jgi:protein-tyrosine phosphatase